MKVNRSSQLLNVPRVKNNNYLTENQKTPKVVPNEPRPPLTPQNSIKKYENESLDPNVKFCIEKKQREWCVIL